ncbi:hypothetical protein JS515_01790 [Clavibacter sp. DM3]|nr:hypothetical protein [Clavibacter zhangzhiyongii]
MPEAPAGLVHALAAAHEVAAVEGVGLMLRPRSTAGGRAVLVVDDALVAWWDALVSADPRDAAARLGSALAAAAVEARPTERYRLLDGDGFTPSTRAVRPALRDASPPSSGGRWVPYVPRDAG